MTTFTLQKAKRSVRDSDERIVDDVDFILNFGTSLHSERAIASAYTRYLRRITIICLINNNLKSHASN